ncbi:MFS transporter [Paraglaciecola sp. 20A4]|uniref:MFS transporter n=1 Tax=Paraglaciecola sp. 20A4 TaxID=2687288 RepID=UPI00140ACE28|nr:MFS transporter [Paraglaciecola sp. 20A4]
MLNLPDIPRQHKMAIGFGFLALFFANQSLSAMAIPYFQMTLGIDPFWLSLVIAAPIMFAAFISQKVGQVSDGINARKGNRRGILLVSGIACGLLFGAIWMAPNQWSNNATLMYVLLVNFMFCIGLTFLTINVKSLAFEFSIDEKQRVKVMAFGSLFERIGTFAYFWLFPLAQLSVWGSIYLGIQYVGWFIGIVLIGLFSVLTAWFSVTKPMVTNSAANKTPVHLTNQLFITDRKNNKLSVRNSALSTMPVNAPVDDTVVKRALFLLLSLTLIKFGAIAIFTSFDFYLLVYFVKDGDLAEGASWKGILSSTFAIVTLVMIPLFAALTLKLGKLRTLSIIYWITALGAILKWFIYQPGHEWGVVIDALLGAPSWVAISVIIPSMLADLCAYERSLSGRNKVGYFISVQNKVINFSVVISMVGSGLLLNAVGFDASAGAKQSVDSILWMRICLAGGPLLLCFLSLFIVKIYPLAEHQMASCQTKNALGQT